MPEIVTITDEPDKVVVTEQDGIALVTVVAQGPQGPAGDTDLLASVAFTGEYDDLEGKPTIPDVAGKADTTYVDTRSAILQAAIDGKPDTSDLSTVGLTGEYADLLNKPDIPAHLVYDVKFGVTVDGVRYQAVGDGSTDDAPALRMIEDKINEDGFGVMWFPPGRYMCRSHVWIRNGVTVDGVSNASILTSDVEGLLGIFRTDQSHEIPDGWVCQNITFEGTVTSFPTVPTSDRDRTPGPFHAIKVNGSFAPEVQDDFGQPTSGPLIRNIYLNNIKVKNMASLPITIFGVSGRHVTSNCEFEYTKDAGWVFNEEVILIGSRSYGSNDNGFSLSRGNRKVVCVGNTVENAALYGIWLSGYNSSIGPTEFVCTGNTVIDTGRACINLDFGPSFGIIANNYLNQGYHRGPVGHVGDIGTDGISISGASGNVHATGLLVTNNVIKNAARNGIGIKELDNALISGNHIINPGMDYRANGTEILAIDTDSNHGISMNTAGTYSNVRVMGNNLVESRSTPLGNLPIYRPNTSGTRMARNEATGAWRVKNNTLTINDTVMPGNPVVLQMAGDDTSVEVQWNMRGSGKLALRNADGSVLNLHSTSTSNAAKATMLMSAGADDTDYIGAVTASRNGDATSSTVAIRPFRNNLLASDGTAAPFWVKGMPSNSRGIIGLGGGQVNWRTAVDNTAYTANANDYLIVWTNLTAGRTLTLKDAATLDAGQTYIIADESGLAGTHNITIAPLVGTINGAVNVKLASNYGQLLVWSDGTNWHSSLDLSGKVDVVADKGLSTNDYTTADQSKLAGIAPGATQNSSDASLRDRSTHTGSQPISSVTTLQTALDSKATDSAVLHLTGGETVAGVVTFASRPVLTGVSDSSGSQILGLAAVASAVNYVQLSNAAAGAAAAVSAAGSDTNIPLVITGKGNGSVNIRPAANSVSGVKLQNANGANTVLNVDTSNLRIGIGNAAPNSSLHVSGSLATAVTATALNAATTLTAAHEAVEIDTTANITLPALSTCQGRVYELVNINAGTATIKGNGTELIGNVTTANTLSIPSGETRVLKAFPGAWRVMSAS
jgi:hypothetical protein